MYVFAIIPIRHKNPELITDVNTGNTETEYRDVYGYA
jgi:hypothetical protein